MINNRGEAIDFLQDQYPDENVRIVHEVNMLLGGEERKRVWLFSPTGSDFGSEEGSIHWLVEDETVVVTHQSGANFSQAYREMAQTKENLNRAAEDQRMVVIVNAVADRQKINYEQVENVLDEIERDYALKPIDTVRAYQLCDARQQIAKLEEAVYGEA